MKKFPVFIAIIILSPLIASVYGIIHDQLTYILSPEYYIHFKFIQIGLGPAHTTYEPESMRLLVTLVGIMATWWMGLPIGVLLGIAGLYLPDGKMMFRTFLRAISIVLFVTIVLGFIGYLYGLLFLAGTDPDWYIPEVVSDRKAFIAVGSMHNFSYAGGVMGTITGVVYIVVQGRRLRR